MSRKTDYETFIQKFEPEETKENAIKLYETYEQEWKQKAGEECEFLWTLVEGDNDNWYIVPGFHYVNRMNYIITKVPWKDRQRTYKY